AASNVHAYQNVVLQASTHEDVKSLDGSLGVTFGANVAASVSAVVLNKQTWASINGGTIAADGNVLLSADSSANYDPLALQGTIGGFVGLNVSGTVYRDAADTRAFITGGATVDALALRNSATVFTGTKTGGTR